MTAPKRVWLTATEARANTSREGLGDIALEYRLVKPKRREAIAWIVKRDEAEPYWSEAGWTSSLTLARRFATRDRAMSYCADDAGERLVRLVRRSTT